MEAKLCADRNNTGTDSVLAMLNHRSTIMQICASPTVAQHSSAEEVAKDGHAMLTNAMAGSTEPPQDDLHQGGRAEHEPIHNIGIKNLRQLARCKHHYLAGACYTILEEPAAAA